MIEWQPVLLSLKVAFASLVLVFALGVSAAYVMRNCSFPGKPALEALFTLFVLIGEAVRDAFDPRKVI